MAVRWIGPYQILETLGAGAMGQVYLADDPRLRRRVALKTLSADDSRTPEGRRRILREARAAARLTHPNVAAVYDVVENDDGVHIIMEYVRGESLAAQLDRAPLPPAAALEVAVQLADALAEAHAMGVIHRDLKPGNVMVGSDGRPKVLDFGLARTHAVAIRGSMVDSGSSDRPSDARRVVGTPPYVPPEVFLGCAADARSDIYSLGVTLFEMLTGRRPFEGKDIDTLALAVMSEPTPRVRQWSPDVPPGLEAVVARAMARRPEDRFVSAAELAASLRSEQRRLADGPTRSWRGPLPAGRSARLESLSWRSPRPYAVTASAVAVAVGLWALLPPGTPAGRANAGSAVIAVLPLVNATGNPANDHIGVGIADVLVATLAQVPGVTMISRNATLDYRDRKKEVAAIARDLGADLIADGTVQASGETVRVSLSLQRPHSNQIVWSRTYDGKLADIFTLQNEAAAAVSKALEVTLTADERRRIERPPTKNVEALAEYWQAMSFLERPDVKGNLDRSIALFQSAVAKDPHFARAHAGLGRAYWRTFQNTREVEWSEKALVATLESLRLDPDDAAVQYALAVVYAGRGRTEEAFSALKRAIELQPGNDEAHSLMGRLLFDQGRRDEGLAELKRAMMLRPNYWNHYYEIGICYTDAGRYPEAEAAFQRVIELQPDSSRGFYMLGTVQLARGDTPQAITNLRRAIALGSESAAYTNLGHALYEQRRYAEAAKAYEEAARLAPGSPMKQRNLGDVYAKLGEPARSTRAYELAVELCHQQLRTTPRDARTLSQLAVYEAKLGRAIEARRHADEAVALSPNMGDVNYRRAVALALTGKHDDSLAALQQAFSRGYSRKLASTDEDLAIFHGRPAFEALIGGISPPPEKGGS